MSKLPEARPPLILRLSVTDRCQFRCLYCMPAEGAALCRHQALLSFEEIAEFVRLLQPFYDIRKVRLTGGDPLGLILLALPQIPLSLGNSLFATHQMAGDLFPERRVKLRTIGYTYSLLNVASACFGGIPVCHGSGGMAGHYVFGGRTGGSVLLYGLFLIALGVFWGTGFGRIVHLFPLPVLGVILLAESGMLIRCVRDVVPCRYDLAVAVLTATTAVLMPYGFLVGMVAGTVAAYAPRMWQRLSSTARVIPITEVEDV